MTVHVVNLDMPFPERDVKSQRGMPQTEGPILIGRMFPDMTLEEACLLPIIDYIPPDNESGRNSEKHRNEVYGIADLRHVALVWVFVSKEERCMLLPQVYDTHGRPYEDYREMVRVAWRDCPQRLEIEGALRSVERDATGAPLAVPSAAPLATRLAAPTATFTATPLATPSAAHLAREVVPQTTAPLREIEPAISLAVTETDAEKAAREATRLSRLEVVTLLDDDDDDEEGVEAPSHGQQTRVSVPTKRPTDGPAGRPQKRSKRRSPTASTRTGSSSHSSSPVSYAVSHLSSPLASSECSGYSTDATSIEESPRSPKSPPLPAPEKDTDVGMLDQNFEPEDLMTPEEIEASIAEIDAVTARQQAVTAGPATPRHTGKRKEQRSWEMIERSVLRGLVMLGQQDLERTGIWYEIFLNDLLEIKTLLEARPVDHPDRLRWDEPIDRLILTYITEG